jgi:hypothetical protein
VRTKEKEKPSDPEDDVLFVEAGLYYGTHRLEATE